MFTLPAQEVFTIHFELDFVQRITCITHAGKIFLLSFLTIRPSFLCRYSGSLKKQSSIRSPQNILYSLWRFLAFAGCASHEPFRKSEGIATTHGAQKECGQWFSLWSFGYCGDFLYHHGCLYTVQRSNLLFHIFTVKLFITYIYRVSLCCVIVFHSSFLVLML